MASTRNIVLIAAARPNFMKVAPILHALRAQDVLRPFLVHTGQHYDARMSDVFFRDLDIPEPDANLGVGSGSHAVQTGQTMIEFEKWLDANPVDAVVVVGDVNATVACALTAAKRGVPVAHVEAGLRSFDVAMPEEVNRMLTDAISRWLFVSEPSGLENLERTGVDPSRVHFVGNVMVDTLFAFKDRALALPTVADLGLSAKAYIYLTSHRPSNVDDPETLAGILDVIAELSVQEQLPVVFPLHPRTGKAIEQFGLQDRIRPIGERVDGECGIFTCPPLGYAEALCLMNGARLILTDSGGIQEESTALQVPCVTLRHNTERPVTVTEGTNRLAGNQPEAIRAAVAEALGSGTGRVPKLWDGHAAERIVDVLVQEVRGG